MGICAHSTSSNKQTRVSRNSDYGRYSKSKDIDGLIENSKKKEFNKIIDKLFAHYDANSNGKL
jgi:hypothetical protein